MDILLGVAMSLFFSSFLGLLKISKKCRLGLEYSATCDVKVGVGE